MTEFPEIVPVPEGAVALPDTAVSLSPEAQLADASLDEEVTPILPDSNVSTDGSSSASANGCVVGSTDVGASSASSDATCVAVPPRRPYADKERLIAYAREYATVYNPAYREFGNDCTNFVSQALASAGWQYRYGMWFSDEAWWYRDPSPSPKQSHTWGGSQNLANFMELSGRAKTIHHWASVKPGDIIFVRYTFYPDGDREANRKAKNKGHTMIVTGKAGSSYLDLLVSYHSSDKPGRLDKRLGEFMAEAEASNDPPVTYYPRRLK